MAVDLNKVAEKLRRQKSLGVTRDGSLREQDPNNDGSRQSRQGLTTLSPKRFFVRS